MRAAVGGGKNGTKLKVIEPPETRGKVYDLTDELTMGRATGCHITLDDTYVSQLHARVFKRDGQVFIEDLGSTNGTYVNRTKVTAPLVVRRGDRLQVGKTVMEVT
jgi:pSer/pThr/pTyr-binding forkhead associated (FHA) protein